jgi:hypothetical protein
LSARVSSGSRREIAEALAGAHFSRAQDQMVGVDLADGVAVPGEVRGVAGFKPADLGLTDAAQFLEGQSAGAAVGGKIG